MYVRVLKRLFDFLISLMALFILVVPFIIVGSLIKIETKGPVMFRQSRVGINGKTFQIYKFRSMYLEAPHNSATSSLNNAESMITKVGNLLRKSSIDELPQFINVLKGDMSIIGPRPVICSETDLIEMRHKNGAESVLPGLTGLAQVHGRDNLPNVQKAQYDGIYAASVSCVTDLQIVVRTIWYVFLHIGIHEGNYKNDGDKARKNNQLDESENKLEGIHSKIE